MNEVGHKLRILRKAKELSLTELSHRVGCSPSYLSMVENGKVDPSVTRLKKIADSLEVTIIDLFQTATTQNVVIRKNERALGKFGKSKTQMEMLMPPHPDRQIDIRLVTIEPGGCSNGEYRHPGEEFGLVLEGRLELSVSGVDYELNEGDSFYFQSDENHRFRNIGNENTVVVWGNHPPSF